MSDEQRINVSIPVASIDGGISDKLSKHGEILAEIKTDLMLLRRELTGYEGQPGRLTLVENDVKGLNGLHNYVRGAWAVIVVLGGLVGYLLLK